MRRISSPDFFSRFDRGEGAEGRVPQVSQKRRDLGHPAVFM
jgi:hypothetical protein